MGAHVILFGPSTAGKTSLMLGLSEFESQYKFNIDKTWTTRPRRLNEGDGENVFVTPAEFELRRDRFIFTFQNWQHKYGITAPEPLKDWEVRLRILRPTLAQQFRRLVVPEPVVFCAIDPFLANPGAIIQMRDPLVDPGELSERVGRFADEAAEADRVADIRFQNRPGLEFATHMLGTCIVDHLYRTGL